MNSEKIIKEYVNGELSSKELQNELYTNKELELFLSDNTKVPPYTNNCNIYQYLIETNLTSITGELDSKDLLCKFLNLKGIECSLDKESEKKYDLLMRVQPSWLDLSDSYFSYLIDKYNNFQGKELEKKVKEDINSNFRCMKKKPKWIQSPQWPIENNKPLLFIGQLDISELRNDTSYCYIFFNEENRTYLTFEQTM